MRIMQPLSALYADNSGEILRIKPFVQPGYDALSSGQRIGLVMSPSYKIKLCHDLL